MPSMQKVIVDRLLASCDHFSADEAWILPERPPILRIKGRMQCLAVENLTEEEAVVLMESLIPTVMRHWYDDHGYVTVWFPRTGEVVFEINIMKVAGACVGHFRKRLQ